MTSSKFVYWKNPLSWVITILLLFGAADQATAQQTCTQPPQGLVSWWDAEGDANDIVGTNHGSLQNGTTFGPGKVGQAFRFDGVNDFVKVPYATNLSPGDQLTLEFWMKGDVNNPMNRCCQGLVGTDFYKIEGFDFERGLGFNVSLSEGKSYVGANTVWGDGYPSGFGLIPGQWHHIAGTSDGSLLWLYVDGRLKSAMVQLGNISPMRTASFLTFGSEDGDSNNPSSTANRYFFGLIDEVSIYNRALSPDEIAAIYAAGEKGKCKFAQQTITVTPSIASRGASVTVSWNGIVSPSATDWIGLYQVGAPNSPFWEWQYVSCSKTATTAKASGTCSFQIPVNPPSGNFNLRLFSNNGFNLLATSSTFVLQ